MHVSVFVVYTAAISYFFVSPVYVMLQPPAKPTMAYKDEEATEHGHNPAEFTVQREDSASKAAGHMRLDLVDEKPGKPLG